MGWLIALGILLVIGMIPVGLRVRYNDAGMRLWVLAGPVRINLYPRPQKEKKKKQEKAPKKEKKPTTGKKASEQKEAKTDPAAAPEKGGRLTDFLPLAQMALEFLGDFRRKLRLDNLYFRLILAGEDPYQVAVSYGRCWAAVGNLLPQLDRLFVIQKRDIEVECDFTASETLVIFHLDLTITIGRLLTTAGKFSVRVLKEYLKIRKKRKGGAKYESKAS